MKSSLLQILKAAMTRVDGAACVERAISVEDDALVCGGERLHVAGKIYALGIGKAAANMAFGLKRALGNRLSDSLVIIPEGTFPPAFLCKTDVLLGNHPYPGKETETATETAIKKFSGLAKDDLVIALISGGGSALLEKPAPGLTIEDIAETTKSLLTAGVPIEDLNAVRRRLSQVKGGGLLRFLAPANSLSLILSDVTGDLAGLVASGPTVPNRGVHEDCLKILSKYGLREQIPASVHRFLQNLPDRNRDGVVGSHASVLVGCNSEALEAAKEKAILMGFDCDILPAPLSGEAASAGKEIVRCALQNKREKKRQRPYLLLAGGETVVRVVGRGRGGRNQELVLSAAIEMDGVKGIALLAVGTDGIDGASPVAGACATGETMECAGKLGLHPERFLRENDSYAFFSALEDAIVIPAGVTNVMDIVIVGIDD